jgi:hypothetical protein
MFVDIADRPDIVPRNRFRVPLLSIAAYGAVQDDSRKDGIIKVALLHSQFRRQKGSKNEQGPDPALSLLARSVAGRR